MSSAAAIRIIDSDHVAFSSKHPLGFVKLLRDTMDERG